MPDYAAAAAVLLQANTKTDGAIEWHFQKKDGSPLKVHGMLSRPSSRCSPQGSQILSRIED